MKTIDRIETQRLILRRWREEDRAPFADINADPKVMEYFKSPLTRAESDSFIDRIENVFEQNGYGFWAVEERGSGKLLGLTGLAPVMFQASFTPAVEIGWRIASDSWGKGYAPEAARMVLDVGFHRLRLPEIVAFTAVINKNSRRVMEKLGMTQDVAAGFDHPNLPEGHMLRSHVLYRMKSPVNHVM